METPFFCSFSVTKPPALPWELVRQPYQEAKEDVRWTIIFAFLAEKVLSDNIADNRIDTYEELFSFKMTGGSVKEFYDIVNIDLGGEEDRSDGKVSHKWRLINPDNTIEAVIITVNGIQQEVMF